MATALLNVKCMQAKHNLMCFLLRSVDLCYLPLKQRVVRKMLPIRLCFINVYIYPNPTPTPYSNADTVNIVQREKRMIYGCEVGKSDRMITCQDTGIPSSFGDVCANRLWAQ